MIETPRLLLREWRNEDLEPFIALNASAKTMHYFPSTLSRNETIAMVERIKQHFADWGYGLYATEVKESGAFIGFIGITHPRFENHLTPCVEIGWRLHYPYWNQGYATEGAQAVVDHSFNHLGLHELYSWTATTNKPSERIMQKIGMNYIGNFVHPNLDANDPLALHVTYKLLNENRSH